MPLVRVSNGGSAPILITLQNNVERFAQYTPTTIIDASHSYSQLKVITYTNLTAAYPNHPLIQVGDTTYNRPAIGSVIDITGQRVVLQVSHNGAVQSLTVELS